jgi:DNA invertase Pin-like site-specific DNA recombinase
MAKDVGLARVSTLDQDPQLQINDLERAGCWPIYVEHVSGVAAKRPVRDQALATLQRGDTLTVWKLDRLGRSMTEVVGIIERLVADKIRFRCLTQPVDTTSAMGKMQLQLLAMFGEFERSLLLERTAAGKARRLAEGKHPGGVALFGFEPDHETVIEADAALVRYVADYVLEGAPMNQIVDTLNWRGFRTRSGSRWQVKSWRRILGSPYVVPILGQEQYNALSRMFAQPGRQHMGRPAIALLSGILACGREGCGQPLYLVQVRQRSGTKRKVYACRKAGSGGRWAGCGSLTISQTRADDHARELFVAAVVGPKFATALDQRQAELLAQDVTAAELDEWRAELVDLDQVQGTRFYSDAMKRRHEELRRMTEQATAKLLAQPDLQEMLSLPKSEEELRRTWDRWDISTRRVWLRRLFHRIVVHPATTRSSASVVESRLEPIWKI